VQLYILAEDQLGIDAVSLGDFDHASDLDAGVED
jgi:hypothetical protein